MRLRRPAEALALILAGGLVASGLAAAPTAASPGPDAAAAADEHWATSWTQSIQRRSGLTFTNRTLRQVSRLSQGGTKIRLRMENTFGPAPMVVDQTTVGLTAEGAAVVPGTMRTVLFGGSRRVTVPAGETVWSDPLDFTTGAQQDVTVSMYVQNATVTTLHDRAGRTNWFAPNGGGNVSATESGDPFDETHGWSYIVGAVDVWSEDMAGTVVAYGSSVVDGNGSESCGPGCAEPDPYMRWTDIVSRRIAAELPADQQLAMVNAGIAGTTASPSCGSGGLDGVSRLSRDVLSLSGVTAVIYYYGTNDLAALGNGCSAASILSSMRSAFAELRGAGIEVFVTPVTPRPGYTTDQNARRADINAFLRAGGDCSGTCDGIIDFDEVLRDPAAPDRIQAAYDVDGLHVNTLGQRALADAVPLAPLVAAGAARITTPAPVAASLGQAYSHLIGTSGRPAPTLSITHGSLPQGLTLDPATGVISGVPTERGRSTFTVEARNGAGTDRLDAVIDVIDGPAFTSGNPPGATVGLPYDFSLQATGHPAPAYAVVGGRLPAGLHLDGATGRISGTPTAAGAATVTVAATNGVGTDISTTFTLPVSAASSSAVLALGDTALRYGTPTTAQVMVFATGAAPTGRVELSAGAVDLGGAVLAPVPGMPGASSADVSVPAAALVPGAHTVTARYVGDTRVLASGDTARLQVSRGVPRVTARQGGPKKLTERVRGKVVVTVRASGVTAPGGRVVIRDGRRKVGTGHVGAGGRVTVRLKKLAAGRHSLSVAYRGSALVEPVAVRMRVRVRKR